MTEDTHRSSGLARKAMSAELLDAETERDLAVRWRDEKDDRALHRLVTAYRQSSSVTARRCRISFRKRISA